MKKPEIFLIHDPLREDRRKLFTREFNEQDIHEWYVVNAVKDQGSPQRNIAEAHKKCIRSAKMNNLDRVVIMEDDVKFACPGAYNEFLKLSGLSLDAGADILISGSYEYILQFPLEGGLSDLSTIVALKRFSGLHCYMINQKAYDTILALPGKINLDKEISASGLSFWMTYPMTAVQYDTFSANVNKVTNYNEIYKDKINLWKGLNVKDVKQE